MAGIYSVNLFNGNVDEVDGVTVIDNTSANTLVVRDILGSTFFGPDSLTGQVTGAGANAQSFVLSNGSDGGAHWKGRLVLPTGFQLFLIAGASIWGVTISGYSLSP